MKRKLHLIIYVAIIVLLTGCAQKPRKFVIGVSQCSEDIWRDKLNDELKMGEYLNDSLIVKLASSNDDNVLQNKQVNQFIDEGVDLLIVSPNQLSAISKSVERAYDKGIPVILYDRKTNSDKYTAFIGCDNYTIGKSMGTFIAQQLQGKGRIVEISGLEGSSPALERHRGFMDAIKPYPGLQVVASEEGNWKEEGGIQAMKRILKQTQDFDYVFAHNDCLAWGAYVAARQMRVKRNYKYTGVDGMATEGGGLELVRDGIFEASYLYPTKGDEVIALAMKILKHQPYERDNYLSTSIITQANAALTLMEARDTERQTHNLKTLHKQVNQYLSDYNSQKVMLIGLCLFLLVCLAAAALIFRGYLIKMKLNETLAKTNGELKRLNVELGEKNEELKRLNEEVLELTHSRLVFFTNISHELRTPLTLIADPVEMLLEDTGIRGKSRELLKMVQRNALALQQLVSNILDFRKIQNGKMELKLYRFDIVKTLTMWVGDFQLTAERKQIRLHLDVDDLKGSHEMIADQEKISRIVFNLLSNALKYTPAGGEIFVSLKDEGTNLRLDVKDTGKGISQDEADKIFERFFQAKGAASGTGIGLALVKSFVELHHGEARVESELGKGSDFIVVIPREQEGDSQVIHNDVDIVDNSVNASASTGKNVVDESVLQYIDDGDRSRGKVQQLVSENTNRPTVLVIDDNTDIRQYERTLLQDEYIVLEAADGKEGLAVALKEVPDLVICDVMMPVMDGLELTEQLKTNTATSHIPVIMLTAKNLEEHRAEGYEHGADSYITKPFHSKVLLARIENLLRQRQLLKNLYQGTKEAEKEISEAHLEDRDKQFLRQLQAIIQQNLSDSEFGVEDMGQQIGLSRVQLYRKVKAMTGSSVVDLLRKARLAKARRLLETRSMSVSEVAYEVGFSAPSYFTKCFKEEYGMLPGDVGNVMK
ncbi:hybrid sensor histidine kinase/response regulator transcription factor [Segatella copri]|uniref:histidine kinase n=1 Tax=Segatella copri DSM 18205 TaxID=537011 RepID=D1PGW4_9BACT|nr:substrate-binding domain-containing protein [Segatella copri]EFB34072.1 ATPase/histidine kinase/DNA gyrase B/HSP90 domain protein [Segatella copri DSM 18205]MCW4097502.1 substrate-binding domain-containing protein [Segatella copri]MQP18975.1 substrate-binding domain-containing protein [Segatella copri DSM 18205]UEA43023.1 substrate-binding domain-containing protein [Segatella copri DSM 18205]UWP52363.1 substrate-binding domain-containing protein [Segatella copri DSM 18205]